MHQKELSGKALVLKRANVAVPPKATYTVEEAAALLGVSRETAYEGCRDGQIPSIRIGKRVLVPRAALDQMLGGAVA
jgi:excisionase family DNA binding protein